MSEAIEDIIVQIIPGAPTVSRVGFGVPLLIGTTGQFGVLISGSGTSEIIYRTSVRQGVTDIRVTEVVGAFTYNSSPGLIIITYPPGTLVRDLITDFDANAGAPIQAILELKTSGNGSGLVVPVGQTTPSIIDVPLAFEIFREIQDASQVDNFYDETDPEHIMVTNIFASVPHPVTMFLLDVFNAGDLGLLISDNDDGSWYAMITDSQIEATQQIIVDHADGNKRLPILDAPDLTLVNAIKSTRPAWLVHDASTDFPAASWTAKNLPQDPGAITWKFTSNLQGQTANLTASLTDLLNTRNAGAQSYVLQNGVSIVDEGQTNDPAGAQKTFIDQIRSRDFISINMEADLNQLFIDQSVAGLKVPYTDAGIAQVVTIVSNRLRLAGLQGIIAPIESSAQALVASDDTFRFRVDFPTRAQIVLAKPGNITARLLEDITFQYIDSGAIHEVKPITGRVVLTLS